ncbi:uncharacterized protein KY384_005925 [Bacidia gigantensis]|uniref:uncharacterized protein n=1 Tax=Bacidia gigantensis TaxID=2732470 RepID=UPI001D058EDD|nr:uncharacterized protein KY384_005925 [Bacidia gigantensis]KAG8529290.1 hypothetical protein KY384_005925 [Bacidia gigantensis]
MATEHSNESQPKEDQPLPQAESTPVEEDKEQAASHSNEERAAEDFGSRYLRQVTADFADDIEKLRTASDFKESSVPVLIQALKEGAANFTEKEKREMMDQGRGIPSE